MSRKTSVATLVSAALLAVCAIVMLHAGRAAVASVLYCRSRYGALATDAEKIQRACRLAHALYPFDYYACIWAGKTALHGRAGDASARRQDLADRWSERGVRLNPLNGELVQLRVDALFPTAPDEAVALRAAIRIAEKRGVGVDKRLGMCNDSLVGLGRVMLPCRIG